MYLNIIIALQTVVAFDTQSRPSLPGIPSRPSRPCNTFLQGHEPLCEVDCSSANSVKIEKNRLRIVASLEVIKDDLEIVMHHLYLYYNRYAPVP